MLVSAATTLAILWIWERSHPEPEPIVIYQESSPEINAAATNTQPMTPQVTWTEPSLEMAENIDVLIRSVVGAGNLEAEYVEIYNQSDGIVDLSGWRLSDENQNQFIFGSLLLSNGGSIKVFSTSGQNLARIELYWNQNAPIWQSNEIATLIDASGNIISTYQIP